MGRKLWPVAALLVLSIACGALAHDARTGQVPSFPITLKAANGYVTISARPKRIVSLSPTATETLFAIGAGGQVVAVDDQSNYPSTAPKTALSGYRPNAEAVAAYHPDLVITSSSANNLLPALSKLAIPVLLDPAARSIGDAYVQMRQLGFATGHDAAARKLVGGMKQEITAEVASVPKARGISVFHELSPDLYSATSSTFIGKVYSLFGVSNIADAADKTGSGYPKLSSEYVIASNPSLIVLADTICCGQNTSTVRARPGWSSIRAVRTSNVVAASDDVTSRWGPRIVAFVRAVATAVRRAKQ